MLATAKNYRENVIAISKSSMPLERKKRIISEMLEQISILSDGDSSHLPKNLKALTNDEKDILNTIFLEVQETLNNLR